MLRLLIVFFLGMFWKLVFRKLQNVRWIRNVTLILCCRGAWSAWSKLLKPPYIYRTHWHCITKKYTSLIKNITSQKLHLTIYTANLHTLLLLVFWRSISSRLQMSLKIGVLKNVSTFTEKHLSWSLILIKLQAFSSEFY